MYSNSILKRFVKDYKLPIQIIQEPYFSYFINLYDNLHDTKNKFNLFENTVNKFDSEEDFFNHYNKVKDNILNTIKSTEAFKSFNNEKLDEYNIPNLNYCKHDIFNLSNIGKYFVSIDLKKANFQAMKYYNQELVLNCNTYEELISKFTDLKYIKDSKYIRQVIFGNMNPKKQIKIEQYLIYQVLNLLISEKIIKENQIKMISPDEIVFELYNIENINDSNRLDLQIQNLIKTKLNLFTDVEIYKLININPYKFFIKEFIFGNRQELMCIPIVYYAQVYKKYYNLELNDFDLSFFYENQIAKFVKPLDFNKEVIFDENTTDNQ